MNGIELKEDLQKLDQHYSSMPDEVRKQRLWTLALVPPEDTNFLITRLWDKYLPLWREHKDLPNLDTPEHQQMLVEEINKFADDDIRKLCHMMSMTSQSWITSRSDT